MEGWLCRKRKLFRSRNGSYRKKPADARALLSMKFLFMSNSARGRVFVASKVNVGVCARQSVVVVHDIMEWLGLYGGWQLTERMEERSITRFPLLSVA